MARLHDAPASSAKVLLLGFRGALNVGLHEVIDRDEQLHAVSAEADHNFAALIRAHEPDLVLVDSEALASAIELRRLVLARPATPVVVAVQRLNRDRDDALLAAGARAVLPFTVDAHELLAILRLIARGLIGPPRSHRAPALAGLGMLTAREAQVLELLADRRSAIDIAALLHVSVATVNSHRRHIYEKLGVHSRRELAPYAAKLRDAAELGRRAPRALAPDRLAYRLSRRVLALRA